MIMPFSWIDGQVFVMQIVYGAQSNWENQPSIDMVDVCFSSLVFLEKPAIDTALKHGIFYTNLYPRSNFSFLLPVMVLDAFYYRAIYFLSIPLGICRPSSSWHLNRQDTSLDLLQVCWILYQQKQFSHLGKNWKPWCKAHKMTELVCDHLSSFPSFFSWSMPWVHSQ